jgi:hypothetical protein|tara:strand:+ start:8894 stop:9067 length:174 start_codon:yes stop_codon:yes gene_type:complete
MADEQPNLGTKFNRLFNAGLIQWESKDDGARINSRWKLSETVKQLTVAEAHQKRMEN